MKAAGKALETNEILIGSIIFAIFTPHSAWRGQVLFALIFAPLGCILRFQLSVSLNRRISSFPLGTFFANILGSLTLGMCYDLQRSSPPSARGHLNSTRSRSSTLISTARALYASRSLV